MKCIYIIFSLLLGGCFITGCTGLIELSKEKIVQNIKTWYVEQGKKYSLNLSANNTRVNITRYHPERPEENDNMLEIIHKGMKIQLLFSKPVRELLIHQDSLQKYFNFLSIDKIYNTIPSNGWEIYPETPQSSLRGTGIQFTDAGKSLSFHLNWSTYTVMGYKESNHCQEERLQQDASISEECMVYVDQKLALEIIARALVFES